VFHFGSVINCCRCAFFIMLFCLPMIKLLILYWINLLSLSSGIPLYALSYRICAQGQYAHICVFIWIYFLACGFYAEVSRPFFFLERAGELRTKYIKKKDGGKDPKWYSLGPVPNSNKGSLSSKRNLLAILLFPVGHMIFLLIRMA